MSAPTVAECPIVLTARHGPVGRTVFERLRTEINLDVAHFTDEHAAAAQLSHEPLLAVGNDFTETDLEFSGGVIGYWPAPTTN
jgi:ribonuclease VapC